MTNLRRPDKEIKEKAEIVQVLFEAGVGRLGTCYNNQPYIVPVSFVYHNDKIIIHGAKIGKKMENIAKNPRVCFEVDTSEIIPSEKSCNFTYRYKSVIVQGIAHVLENPREKTDALKLLVEKYAPHKGDQLTEKEVKTFDNLAVIIINIEEMVGKKSPS
jgi:nitroimidazol reductase NimA-like FMN-containing flavoprotein (pyridoxamine 5'-phosphate oxidase superfamily)